jgi:SAM-dependent methyltransferase
MAKLNIGCGRDYREQEGWVNYDLSPICDVVGDWTEGLPFKEKSFDTVFAAHVLEHIVDLAAFKKELVRIMAPEAIIEIIVPNYLSIDAWSDPTHVRAFSMLSFQDIFWPGFEAVKRTRIYCRPPDWYQLDEANQEQTVWLDIMLRRNCQPYNIVKKQFDGHAKAGGIGGIT